MAAGDRVMMISMVFGCLIAVVAVLQCAEAQSMFNFISDAHTVAEVTKADYDACNAAANPIGSVLSTSPARIGLNSAGNHYYICTVGQHCVGGQKLSITVRASGATAPSPSPSPSTTATPPPSPTTAVSPPPSTSTTPTSSTPPPPSGSNMTPSSAPSGSTTPPPPSPAPSLAVAERERNMGSRVGLIGFVLVLAAFLYEANAETYTVLDTIGWEIPPDGNGDAAYRNWTKGKEFEVGDTLLFNFGTGQHNVAKVSKEGYDNCTAMNPNSIMATGPVTITLNSEGEHYFICTIGQHCKLGQKLAITVKNDSGTKTPSGSGPSGTPPSSASSMAIGSFCLAILFISITLLH
ncbi:Plastocyanin-like [Macleaya cordata]|uniref:Plastocyanin-like n=1 Tax=Macleaya cordata TaxID=56857 RepID=A0A200PNU5_MACCD|nr:Plastocyanin-like [Macleaya cordata]